jgi:CheY-like chemotaxis protein
VGDVVLIADDEEDIIRFVEINLRLEGLDVLTARDGEEALQQALHQRPSLLLLDAMMPRMDGYEVCAKLRADERTFQMPIIMLTAKSLEADRVLAREVGADDVIIKPFDPTDLVDKVKTLLAGGVRPAAAGAWSEPSEGEPWLTGGGDDPPGGGAWPAAEVPSGGSGDPWFGDAAPSRGDGDPEPDGHALPAGGDPWPDDEDHDPWSPGGRWPSR